jgi:hypothetical protein
MSCGDRSESMLMTRAMGPGSETGYSLGRVGLRSKLRPFTHSSSPLLHDFAVDSVVALL